MHEYISPGKWQSKARQSECTIITTTTTTNHLVQKKSMRMKQLTDACAQGSSINAHFPAGSRAALAWRMRGRLPLRKEMRKQTGRRCRKKKSHISIQSMQVASSGDLLAVARKQCQQLRCSMTRVEGRWRSSTEAEA